MKASVLVFMVQIYRPNLLFYSNFLIFFEIYIKIEYFENYLHKNF